MSYKKHTALYAFALALLLAGLLAPATWAKDKGWELIIDDGFHSVATSVAVLPDKSILVGGTTCYKQSKKNLKWIAWIKRFDAQGKLIWSKEFDNGVGQVSKIIVFPSGAFVFYGDMEKKKEKRCKDHQIPVHFWFVKMTTAGEIVWQRTIGKHKSDDAISFLERSDGGYLVVGYVTTQNCKNTGWVAWLDSEGMVKTEQFLGKNNGSLVVGPAVELTGGAGVITAATHIFGEGAKTENHKKVLRLNDDGSVVWEVALKEGLTMWNSSVVPTSDGCAILSGWEKQLNAGPEKMLLGWLLKIDSDGKVLWVQKYPLGIRYGHTGPLVALPNGGFVLADEGSYWSASDYNAALTQLTAKGKLSSRVKFSANHFSAIRALAYSPDNSIMAVGFWSRSPKSPLAQWIMKIPLPLAGGQ